MTLTPLITADEGYPAFEALVSGAQDHVFLSFRIFDPKTRLRRPDLRERGLENWADLITWTARRGVRIRILLADFDPLLAPDLHRQAWAAATGFADTATGDTQVLCAPHGQAAGPLWRALARPMLRKARDRLARSDMPLTALQRHALKAPTPLRPATLHQKFAVADGALCVIGGLDIDERRFDDPGHTRLPEDTWHDVSMQIADTDFAAALDSHFATCWNMAIEAGAENFGDGASRIDTAIRRQSRPELRLVRTLTTPRRGLAALGPKPLVRDHETLLIETFSNARHWIYAETQFLRHVPIAEALARASAAAPDLQLVLLLPAAPERLLFGDTTGWDLRHGMALQTRALHRLAQAFGDRLALVTPAQSLPAPEGRPAIAGAGPIYVHSKVVLIDGDFGLVGSANLNGRSMCWDTEASVAFTDAAAVAALHERLAAKWLGPHLQAHDPRRAATWRQAALANAAAEPADRLSPVLPLPIPETTPPSRLGRFVPEALF
ncbi:cardiolipin synthase [Thalassococcus sp. CAU 1522]|uniref:Phospholipase D n=1 Tax=Thalassococcus arenae TaxID=2851652 RepID=A0ABS6N7H7_9RHOB|nr:phospholipase D family protein [Thalassococcus arenae]MBV2359952.1 cardiolipin synthase [Thalassococcus arenae]